MHRMPSMPYTDVKQALSTIITTGLIYVLRFIKKHPICDPLHYRQCHAHAGLHSISVFTLENMYSTLYNINDTVGSTNDICPYWAQ